ncbi:MAG: M14 family metallopeptidase [Flavobacteriaceae bacterium]|nr:M14 family metallopeptidase [Flavobacteriaceae bacterium]
MKKLSFLLLFVVQLSFAQTTVDLNYYLPQNVQYNKEIPTPKSVVGHEVGEWHITHDKLLFYMQSLAKASDRISIEDRGTTFEGRPLVLLTITSPRNHANLVKIRKDHIQLTEENAVGMDVEKMPLVVYQGFSIHGNEPSGSNAALALAYYLAAAQGAEVEALLNDVVILFDPCYNPDGLQRFASWVNVHKSKNLNPDNNDREYEEVWPRGRTNHYWFDMNRDWLPVQLPESRARIESFHKWYPNILTDHHEMGTNSTFFFQPGVPSRTNPSTPAMNQQLTKEIAQFHIKAFDKIGSLYYSEENFDDFYYGKGSTFPDITGAVGILFEQGSARGHIQNSENGVLTFPFAIRNQFTAGLSTLAAAKSMRVKMLNYQRDFYKNVRANAQKSKTKAYVFGDPKDAAKSWHMAEILKRHKIDFYQLKQDAIIEGKQYKKGYSYVVPLEQKNNKLIHAMFDTRTKFRDSIFYDISGWTFPLAFNLGYAPLKNMSHAGEKIGDLPILKAGVDQKSDYAYLFEWHEYYTPKLLNAILQKGLRAKVGKSKFKLGNKQYDYGTIMIPVQNQKLDAAQLYAFLDKAAKEAKVVIDGVHTGNTEGIDLGSRSFFALKNPKVAILVGGSVTSYDAGEIWHLMDQRYDIRLTKIDVNSLSRIDLSGYTAFILPNSWGGMSENVGNKLRDYVRDGGVLIGYRNAVSWLKKEKLLKVDYKENKALEAKNIRFDQRGDFRGAQVTGGAIFNATIDRSHPINYGYSWDQLPMFRNTNVYLKPNKQSYNNPIQYTNNPLLCGYISEENLEVLKRSVPFAVNGFGRGRVIGFTDNTNFRAFWYGTNKLLMNAIFFGKMM